MQKGEGHKVQTKMISEPTVGSDTFDKRLQKATGTPTISPHLFFFYTVSPHNPINNIYLNSSGQR